MGRDKFSWTMTNLPASGIRGLKPEEIGVVYQPIVEIATKRVFAQEVLVRCTRPEWKAPPVLFETAVKEEACGRLGRLIRTKAFEGASGVSLFVNLHPAELSSHWLVQPDDPIGFHDKLVFLEITETAAFSHHELCMSVLRDLCRRTGAYLVIDDFGAGYSNLERVVDLEPAIVKLDLALTRDIHKHRRKQAVARHVAALCKELGSRVVAEGIESADELACIEDLGIEFVQGYYIARPASPMPLPEGVWSSPAAAPAVAPPVPSTRRTRPSLRAKSRSGR